MERGGYPRPAYPAAQDYGYGYGSGGDEGRIDVRALWRTVRKRLWLIASIAVIVTSIVTIEVYRSRSIYQATAKVEIGKDATTLVRTADLLVQADDSDDIKTKILVLQSRPVLEDVVAKLELDKNPKFLDLSKKSFWEALKTIGGKVYPQFAPNGPPPAPAPDSQTATSGKRTPQESARLGPYVGVLYSNLLIESIPGTRALSISYSHTEPSIASAVANGVTETFIEKNFEAKTEKFTKTSDWLDVTTRKLEAKVQQSEQELANYVREHNLFSADGKETLTNDKVSRLQEQAMRAETDRILKESMYEEVKAGRGAQLPDSVTGQKTETAALRSRLGELAVSEAQMAGKYGPDHPKLREIKEQKQALQKQLDEQTVDTRRGLEEKVKADYERALRDEKALKGALERAKGEAVQQNQSSIQLGLLTQNVETTKKLYTDFLQRHNQAQLQVAEQHNNMHVIEPAQTPGSPIGPNRFRTILIGLFLSLAGGVGLAFFLEYLDNTIKTVEDVGKYAQLPALGVIPALALVGERKSLGSGKRRQISVGQKGAAEKMGVQTNMLASLDSRSSAAEAYRVLRTSVLLSAAGSPPKTMLVTSGQPGEGKTTTVVNTAISLAQLGASVLIIDCDLRRPTAHKVLGANNTKGVSTYLSRDIEIDGLIQKLQIPNLSILACGPIPPNPAELIGSDRMKDLLRMLSERYDHILIDSPPLMHVTDPVILSTLVDGVIMVVHGGKSTRDVVRRARQEMTTVGAKIFGVVLNNVDLKREGYDYYYYYRYHSEYYGADKGDRADA